MRGRLKRLRGRCRRGRRRSISRSKIGLIVKLGLMRSNENETTYYSKSKT